jgi:NTP pyrophosphatase (non-canonical NTP hydrolase)
VKLPACISPDAARAEERLDRVLDLIAAERERQEQLHAGKKLQGAHCSARGVSNAAKLAVLTEDVGEVAKQINEGTLLTKDRAKLRKELIQVAAVATGWAESLDERP